MIKYIIEKYVNLKYVDLEGYNKGFKKSIIKNKY